MTSKVYDKLKEIIETHKIIPCGRCKHYQAVEGKVYGMCQLRPGNPGDRVPVYYTCPEGEERDMQTLIDAIKEVSNEG